MPELPEVETIRLELLENIKGKRIEKIEVKLPKLLYQISSSDFIEKLINVKIKDIRRRAKILILDLMSYSLLIHLKLTGQLLYEPSSSPLVKHTHVIFYLDGNMSLRFWDLRQFGYLMLIPTEKIDTLPEIKKLGPEPLSEEFTLEKFQCLLKNKKRGKIKSLLMDQTFIAGIGNLYSDEILYASKIHPERDVTKLNPEEVSLLYQNIKKILSAAIKQKGSSVDTYLDIFKEKGKYHFNLKVYGKEKENCFLCTTKISRLKIGGRSSYFCSQCQK